MLARAMARSLALSSRAGCALHDQRDRGDQPVAHDRTCSLPNESAAFQQWGRHGAVVSRLTDNPVAVSVSIPLVLRIDPAPVRSIAVRDGLRAGPEAGIRLGLAAGIRP